MKTKHGAQGKGGTALLLIDVINDFDFEGGEALLAAARPVAPAIAALKARAHEAGAPAIYVNDHFGRWQSDFAKQIARCLAIEARGRDFVQQLHPHPHDYFILKPKHSGFYGTPLALLLRHLEVETIILTGIAAHSCVLSTAYDAHMQDFRVIVPADCVAAAESEDVSAALRLLSSALGADTRESRMLDL